MVSGIDRPNKIYPSDGKTKEVKQRCGANRPAIAAENTLIDSIAHQLARVSNERRKEQLAQILVAEVLETKLGLSGVSEPEYARLVESIKTILLSSDEAMTRLEEALNLVANQVHNLKDG
jgi:hypothetical protein